MRAHGSDSFPVVPMLHNQSVDRLSFAQIHIRTRARYALRPRTPPRDQTARTPLSYPAFSCRSSNLHTCVDDTAGWHSWHRRPRRQGSSPLSRVNRNSLAFPLSCSRLRLRAASSQMPRRLLSLCLFSFCFPFLLDSPDL